MERVRKKSDDDILLSGIEGIHYSNGKPVRLEVKNGIITEIQEIKVLSNQQTKLYVAPGLIDNQINGYAGIDFSGNRLNDNDLLTAAQAIWSEGVTSFIPTVITNSHENIVKNLTILGEACKADEQLRKSIPGFHLEGPYLSPVEGYRGCHPEQYMRKPSFKEFSEYQKASGGRIIQVTVAPELEGAMEFIKECTGNGIIVAIGHSNASADKINRAVDNGATISTHLGNGCANLIHRHNNPLWPQLANEKLTPSIIADGHHLTADEIKVFCKVKGTDNIILTSDVIYLAGMVPGRYLFLGADVLLKDDGMLINEELNCLAGASFPLKKGVENIMKLAGYSLSDAIKMASENVARLYRLNSLGTLEKGKRADIILFELVENQIHIKQTILSGKTVFKYN
ncbi:MAG: N-acetylglucosamine-6-phosphate deacetylase [Bacteroidales bacterium]|nr:N-acetylglucosamine-6-phosphate deacetylase [Bacteroidales bacterium]